jgi:hypothetical protein
MTLLLHKGGTQARIAGFERQDCGDDDYDVVHDTTVVGRIYRNGCSASELKWRLVPTDSASDAAEQRRDRQGR